MAITYSTTQGTLVRPGAYVSYDVAQDPSGTASVGVITLIGEADNGPNFSQEEFPTENWFGPDQTSAVKAKYKSGPLVDAFVNAANPSIDPAITGGPTRIYLVKTNKGSKASATLPFVDVDWAVIEDRSYGDSLMTVTVKDINAVGENRRVRVTVTKDDAEASTEAGGDVFLRVGSSIADTTVAVDKEAGKLIIDVGGLEEVEFSFETYKTIRQLVNAINSIDDVRAVVGGPSFANEPCAALDDVPAFDIFDADTSEYPGELFADAASLYAAIERDIPFARLAGEPLHGLPAEVENLTFTGGARGTTTKDDFNNAMTVVSRITTNFVVPLFSRDTDIEGYTIEEMNLFLRDHAHSSSTLKAKRNRQVFPSYYNESMRDTKNLAAVLGSARASLPFVQARSINGDGGQTWFDPWIISVVAAGMQAAGGYRSIFNKATVISGIRHPNFTYEDNSQVEDALLSGLLVIERREDGSHAFVSDQTTYGRDANFVFNSIQAVYAADVVGMTLMQSTQRAFVGASLADISAAVVRTFVESICLDLFRLKYLASSDDGAPFGFKNVQIQINGPVIEISLEVKIAGSVYFIPIRFTISPVVQSA